MSLLQVEELNCHHGLLHAVRDVSIGLSAGETLAVVGANGAGKTTLLRTVAGVHRATSGRVLLGDADVTGMPSHRRLHLGIALVPEGRRLFPGLTVEENLGVATVPGRSGTWDIDAVLQAFPMLQRLRNRVAANLSGGEQQATAIGRALMSNPTVLLLDEVSLGLAPIAVEAVYDSLQTVLSHGKTTVVLVEQDLGRALEVASRIVCMLEGRVMLEGLAADLTREQVTEAYFGMRRQAMVRP